MRGARFENDLSDMAPGPAADMAKPHRGSIVGIKTAHYAGPEWTPVENAVEAGTAAAIPVMVDFGNGLSAAAARGPGDEETAAGRYIYALLLRTAARVGRLGACESGHD